MTTEKKLFDMKKILIILLAVNLLLMIYIAFFKRDAYRLETLKVGGRENMQMATQLYKSDIYIQQQKSTLEQYLTSIEQADTGAETPADTSTETPVVTQ